MGAPSRLPTPPPGYFLRLHYTTFEIDADLVHELCLKDPVCDDCNGSGSGSGSNSGGGDDSPPYTGPCTCPPGYHLVLAGIAPNGMPYYRCQNDSVPFQRLCNEDPANPITHPGHHQPAPSAIPKLMVEYMTFAVPESTKIVSQRCADKPVCGLPCLCNCPDGYSLVVRTYIDNQQLKCKKDNDDVAPLIPCAEGQVTFPLGSFP